MSAPDDQPPPAPGPLSASNRLRSIMRPGRLWSTSIFTNFFLSVLNLILTKGLRLVAITLCVRQMGTDSWGEAASTFALLALIGLVVSQGLSALPQIYRVNERALDRPLFFNISAYRLVFAVLVIATLHALATSVPGIGPYVLLYSFVLIPRALSLDWLFHRRERYHLVLAIGSLRALVFFGLIFWQIGPESTARTVIIAELIAETFALVVGYFLLPRAGLANSPRGGSLPLKVLLAAALPMFLVEILNTLTVTTDILFLKIHHGYQAVAEYDIGAKIGMAYFFVGASLVQIVLPKLGRLYAEGDHTAFLRVLSVSSGLLVALGSLLLLPSFYFAPEVVNLLFDKDYSTTIFVFQWMPVWVYVSFMTMLNTIVLLAIGKRKLYFYGTLLATSANVLGFWFLVSVFSGPGAVAARFIGEVLFFIYAFFALPHTIRASYKGEVFLQFTLLVALLLIYAATIDLSRPLGFALSVALCGFVLWRRRVFTRETLKTLRSH